MSHLKTQTDKALWLQRLYELTRMVYSLTDEKKFYHTVASDMARLCCIDSVQWLTEGDLLPSRRTKKVCVYGFSSPGEVKGLIFRADRELTLPHKKFLRQVGSVVEKVFCRIQKTLQLQHGKAQWELAFDTITYPLGLTDLKGNILRSNKTFRQKTGRNKEDVLQKNIFSLFFGKTQGGGPAHLAGQRIRRKTLQGGEEFFEVSVQKIPLQGREDIYFIRFRDVTEQMKRERQMAWQARQGERGIVARSIAHELNNPIGGMILVLQTLRMKHPLLSPDLARDLKDMEATLQRGLHIITNLLNPPPEHLKKTLKVPPPAGGKSF